MQERVASATTCLQVNRQVTIADYINRRANLDRTGNWCGHNSDAPRFFEKPEQHKPRPNILTWAMAAWCRFYNLPSSYFSELRLYRKSERQQRSESREAVASIAQVLLHYTELATLRVGVPQIAEGFRSLKIEFLAEKAGLGLKRAQRAVALLKRAGYLRVIERFDTKEEKGDTRFIGLAAVKCLTPTFFKACGINLQALSAQRKLARKRLKRKHNEMVARSNEQTTMAAKIIDYSGIEKGSKAHVAAMKSLLQTDEAKQIQERDNRLARRNSLRRTRE
ncbi:MAG: hypothetical protein H0U73_05465 [Tatlockia sp.]|nr:hypothetical protein [Tatlockia sp.]